MTAAAMGVAPRIAVESVGDDVDAAVERATRFIGLESLVSQGARIAIKPNFTFPFYKPGVSTSPRVLAAVVRALRPLASELVIVESDGGSHAWTAEEAFDGHEVPRICREFGCKSVNLTNAPRREVSFRVPRRILSRRVGSTSITLELPRILLDETDVLVTVPVPKIHCMTKVSLALKNQWGCLPAAEKRFRYHPWFDALIGEVNRALKTRIVIADGTHMLTGNGPMFGEAIDTGVIVASNHVGAFELAMMRLMGVESWEVGHIERARELGIVPRDLSNVVCNREWRPLAEKPFFLRRTVQNYLALVGFHSDVICWLGYESPLAGPLHTVLYAIKGNPLKQEMESRSKP